MDGCDKKGYGYYRAVWKCLLGVIRMQKRQKERWWGKNEHQRARDGSQTAQPDNRREK